MNRHKLDSRLYVPLIVFTCGSVCSAIGLMFASFWLLTPIGLALFFYFTLLCANKFSTAVIAGWLYGTIVTAGAIAWFWHMPPFDWLGSSSYLHGAYFAGSIWLLTSCTVGIAWALYAGCMWLMREHSAAYFVIPFLYVIVVELSMWLHALIALGNGSLIEPHFSVISFGYVLTENPFLLQFAERGGVAALNLTIASLALVLYLLISIVTASHTYRLLGVKLTTALCFLLLFFSAHYFKTPSTPATKTLSVVVFSADTTHVTDKFAYMGHEVFHTLQSLSETPQLIVLPEGYPLDKILGNENERKKIYKHIFGDAEVLIVYTKLDSRNEIYNSLYFESTKHGTIHEHFKRYLAPEGEYMTHLGHFFISHIPDPLLQKFATRNQNIAEGPPPSVASSEIATVGGLSCYEIFSPSLYRSLVKDHGASILVNSSDPTWFHNSPLYFAKTLQMARVHAVQNRVPFVVANKGTQSYILDSQGNMLGSTPWNTTDVLQESLTVRNP